MTPFVNHRVRVKDVLTGTDIAAAADARLHANRHGRKRRPSRVPAEAGRVESGEAIPVAHLFETLKARTTDMKKPRSARLFH